IAINDDRRHPELAQPRAEGNPPLPAANDDHIRLGGMTELLRFPSALLEPGLPIRDSAVLYSLGSPVTLWLLMTLQLVQRRQQCPGLALSESEITKATPDGGVEFNPALGIRGGLASLLTDRKTARQRPIERLGEHVAHASDSSDGDDVPGASHQPA